MEYKHIVMQTLSEIPPSCGNGTVYPLIRQRKLTVQDVNQVPQGSWNIYTIPFGMESYKMFDIQLLIHDNEVYLKPKTPYFSAEFEKLFNFGIQCKHYDEQKVIKVKSPPDYYKDFNL